MSRLGGKPVSKFGGKPAPRFGERIVADGTIDELAQQLKQAVVGQSAPAPLPYVPGRGTDRIPGRIEGITQPKEAPPAGPAEPRTLVGEYTAAAVRALPDMAENFAKLSLGLVAGPESTKDVGRIFPYGPQPSRDDTAGELSNIAGSLTTQIVAGGGLARGASLAAAEVPAAGRVLAGSAIFGSQGFANTLERTDSVPAALSSAAINAGLGLIPVSQFASENPVVQAAVQKLGNRAVAKVLTKQVIEGLASGGFNLGQAAADEAVARLAGAKAQDIKPGIQFVAGFLGQAVPATVRGLNEVRRFNSIKKRVVDAGLISKEEALIIGDRPQLLSDVLVARAGDNKVDLVADAKGGEPKITVEKDTVTQREKQLLGFSEPFIAAYREAKAKGAPPITELTTDARWLIFPSARAKGYFKAPESLAKKPSVQNKLATLQRKTMLQLSVLRNDAPGFTLTDKVRLAAQLDAEYVEKVDLILKKDNNSSSGTRRKVVKAVESLPKADQTPTLEVLTRVIDSISERFPNETQLGTMDRLLEELDSGQYSLAEAARPMLVELRDKMQTQAEYRPWGERVRQAQVELENTLRALAGLEFAQGREAVAKAARELPPEVRADLLEKAINASKVEELKAIADTVAQAQEKYLRETGIEQLVKLTSKIGKNPQRDTVIEMLKALPKPLRSPTNAAGEGGTQGPASAKNANGGNVAPTVASGRPALRPAVRFRGKVYSDGNSHYEVMQSILGQLYGKAEGIKLLLRDRSELEAAGDEKAKTTLELLDLPDTANGFVDAQDKFLSRDEAAKAKGSAEPLLSTDVQKPAEAKLAEPAAESDTTELKTDQIIKTNPKTGYVQVDETALRSYLEGLSSDQLKVVSDDITMRLRRGQIEQGLYRKALKFDQAEDAYKVQKELNKLPERSKTKQRLDTPLHVLKLVVDPVMEEAKLEQLAQGDRTAGIYDILHGAMVRPYDAHQMNQAQRDQYLDGLAKSELGIDAEGPRGKYNLLSYFQEKLAGTNLTRGRAMTLYALMGDVGRAADLQKYGAKDAVTGETYTADDVKLLSAADRAFVDKAKAHLSSAGYIKKAYRNVLLLTGRLPGVVKGWFPSRRSPEKVQLDSEFDSFSEGLIREIDPLVDRAKAASGPFEIQDFYSTLLNVTDKLSLFGELGKQLYRADALVRNKGFQETFINKQGKAAYKQLQLYLTNIHSQVGHTSTAFDQILNKLQTGFTVSRVALNGFSAAKQYLHIFTLLADGTLSAKDVLGSLTSGAAFKSSVRKEMIANSGLAYQRYVGGHYLRNFLVLANETKLPSKLTVLQHYSMALQRGADRHVMQISWEAAKRTAAREGYKGAELLDRTAELFGVAAGRDQPTDNPLYATELEIQGRRQPLARSFLMFQREQNRVFNVMRRHIVRAVQEPSSSNLAKAGRAVLFGAVANTIGALAVNELRRAAFAKPSSEEDKQLDAIGNITGMFYLAGPVQQLAEGLIRLNRSQIAESLGPIAQTVHDFIDAGVSLWHTQDEGDVKTGTKRGEARGDQQMFRALDKLISGTSSALGLPLWSIWNQGKGLYKWTDDQMRLMTYIEAERAQLKASKQETSARYLQIETTMKSINKIHQLREKGLLRREDAQKQIVQELNRVLP